MPTIRPATIDDARSLAPRLRQADLAEARACVSTSPEELLIGSVRDGEETYATVRDDGLVIALFGVHHLPSSDEILGAVWMLGSEDIRREQTFLFRETSKYLSKCHQKYPLLWNVVDVRNTVHINWLKRFGFIAIHRHERLGVEQRPFIEFVRIDPSCVPSPQPA